VTVPEGLRFEPLVARHEGAVAALLDDPDTEVWSRLPSDP
jgi:hypothetical protein